MKPEQIVALCSKISSKNLSDEEAELLIGMVHANAWLQQVLTEGRITIRRLQKLFGVTTEKRTSHKNKNRGNPEQDEDNKPKNHGRLPETAYTDAEDIDVSHPDLASGNACPEIACDGKLYEIKKAPIIIRIEGHPIASAKRYKLQSLRCNICQTIFTAPLPNGVHPTEKYDAEIKSLLLVNKYFTAVPFYRQEALQYFLGIPFPASTQWDVIKSTVSVLKPVYQALLELAANGAGFYVDDTHVKILAQMQANKKTDKPKEKKACHTTGILSVGEEQTIYLFITDTYAAGRSFDKLWNYRSPDLPKPFFMCDGLTASIPQEVRGNLYLLCHCLAHARRKFYDLQGCYEALAETVLELIGKVYANDKITKEQLMSDEERLAYHKNNSLPVMEALKIYLEQYRKNHLAEPNGSAGKAIKYLLERFEKFTCFTEHPGIPLDNNILEQALKIPIRNRKNAMFYKTAFGAEVAGFAQSLIFTAAQNNVNPHDYLTTLLKHESEVINNPSAWLPWNYKERLVPKELATLCQESVS
jgi:transposase